jgi:long-chain acyl-CoA synthetase
LPGVEVRIVDHPSAPDHGIGEIITRGAHVMKGYFRQPELTAEVIDEEGWLHTGDLGRIDSDGFLYVTGRLKNIIVLPNGKNVQVEEVEEAVSSSLIIKECCVVGHKVHGGLMHGGEEICIVVVPGDELIEDMAGFSEELEERLNQEVDKCAKALTGYKRPTRILVSVDELPKTSTRKIKRMLVSRWVNTQLGET